MHLIPTTFPLSCSPFALLGKRQAMTIQQPTPTLLLATMSLIKANSDVGKTHLDNFTPFALEVMRVSPGEVFSPRRVATEVSAMLGIKLPDRVAEALLKRLARHGQVHREANAFRLADGVADRLPNLRLKQTTFMREQEALVTRLLEFAAETHGLALEREAAGASLYRQIESDTFDLLRVEVLGGVYQSRGGTADLGYVVSGFIARASREDQQSYVAILAAAKGMMLAAAISIPNLGAIEKRFSDTTLYLDAPILLQCSGLDGPEARDACMEILQLAKASGAALACFSHSVTEALSVILTNAELRRTGRSDLARANGVQAWAIRADLDHHDLYLHAAHLQEDLAELGVLSVDRPAHEEAIEVGEMELRKALDDAIHYRALDTLLCDVDSLVAVHNLRHGRTGAVSIETCGAVFITDNDSVARVGRSFFKSEGYAYGWPVATTMSDLATILFLKAPQVASALPERVLLAQAYAGLEPGPALWAKFIRVVESQRNKGDVSPEDIVLLCHAEESRRALMEVTLGRPDHMNEATVTEVLGRARELASAPALSTAKQAADAAAQAAKGKSDAEQLAAEFQAEAAGLRSDLVKAKVETVQRVGGIRSRVIARVRRRTEILARSLLGVVALACLAPEVAGRSGFPLPSPWRELGGVLVVVGLVIGLLSSFFGGAVMTWLSGPQKWAVAKLADRELVRLGVPSEAELAALDAEKPDGVVSLLQLSERAGAEMQPPSGH